MSRDYYAEMQKAYQEAMQMNDATKKVTFSVCPTTFGKPCKLCDLCKHILFNQRGNTAMTIQKARDLNRKDKFYSNIIFITNPSEVVVMEAGTTIGNKLVSFELGADSDLKGFWHKDTGRNLYIVKYPNPDKRKNKYDVEPRIAQSPLMDKSVLDKMYNLDTIIEMARAGEVIPMSQSKFPDGKTEIRVLPSWLGPKYASVFQLKYKLHYNTSEEELEAIQRGEMNPFMDVEPKQPTGIKIVVPQYPQISPATFTPESKWGELETELPPPAATSQDQGKALRCFGTFDPDETTCMDCEDIRECKEETEGMAKRRKVARGLYR